MFVTIPELRQIISEYSYAQVGSQTIIETISKFKKDHYNIWMALLPHDGIDYCYPYKIDGSEFTTYMIDDSFGKQIIMPLIKRFRLYPTQIGYEAIKNTEQILTNTFKLEPFNDIRMPGELHPDNISGNKTLDEDDLSGYIIDRHSKLIRNDIKKINDTVLYLLLQDKPLNLLLERIT